MSDPAVLTIHIDGAARGNPGPAAFAYVIATDGAPPVEAAGCLGRTTNNVAEYTALVRALARAAELGARRLLIHSDSELLVKQMNGQYQVKNPQLLTLYEEAKDLARRFDVVSIRHVPRAQNRRADALCNEALDGKRSPSPAPPAPQPKAPAARAGGALEARVRDEALACLQAAATAWKLDPAHAPSPELVWEQLWSILEENGVLRRPKPR